MNLVPPFRGLARMRAALIRIERRGGVVVDTMLTRGARVRVLDENIEIKVPAGIRETDRPVGGSTSLGWIVYLYDASQEYSMDRFLADRPIWSETEA